jgi:cysteine desulfurase
LKNSQAIYLDANATTAPLDEVVRAVVETMESTARNPASAHFAGATARRLVEDSRDEICRAITGAEPEGVIFLSGGTEANNMVVRAFAPDPLVTFMAARIEHSSLIEPLHGIPQDRVLWIEVKKSGCIDIDDAIDKAKAVSGRIVLTMQAANGETGIVQPLRALVEAIRNCSVGAFVHIDAAQALGRMPLSMIDLDADSMSFSAHKLHGPMGVGALVFRDPDERRVSPLLRGGGQERGLRSGTLNLPGIVGMATALELRRKRFVEANNALTEMRNAFERALADRLGTRVSFNGAAAERVSNTSNARFEGVDGMRLLARLDRAGLAASLGSACSSGRPEPSGALLAMGLSEREAYSSVRFSFSILNTMEEALRAAEIIAENAEEIAE